MRTHRDRPWLWRSLALAVCALPMSACVMDAVVGEVDLCEYKGEKYKLNEKFPAGDGCNSCVCEIDGTASCSEEVCDQVDASIETPTYCKDGTKLYEPGETFPASDRCNTCTCGMDGRASCTTDKDCTTASGSCKYDGKLWQVGEWFPAGDACNKCKCEAQDVVTCSKVDCMGTPPVADAGLEDAATSCAPFTCPMGTGTCSYQGRKFSVGQGFDKGDNCNKCTCIADGLIECSAASCAPPAGCQMGHELLPYGTSVVCEDGCNTCACDMKGLSRTTEACPALPLVTKCLASASVLAFPAPLVYLKDDALAVAEGRCVNGQSSDFTLCFDDFAGTPPSEVGIYVVPTGSTRACSGVNERVYSLADLRAAYSALTQQMGGKLILRGNGDAKLYQFGF